MLKSHLLTIVEPCFDRLFFDRLHTKMPDNIGERRESLCILEKVYWEKGLLDYLVTDAEVSAITIFN